AHTDPISLSFPQGEDVNRQRGFAGAARNVESSSSGQCRRRNARKVYSPMGAVQSRLPPQQRLGSFVG
ncbi:hypothetical protein, partial [Klebsiella pneumoniae]|uniref:hypothetical protein n=1 Tax=Klebsiella pneumoniae TaxID=573 RepID=UPI0019538D4C